MTLRLYVVISVLLFGIGRVSAESHPAWWLYASPQATALVGIQWEHLRTSPFAEAISGELHGEDGLGFPDLDCVKEARQILISSPALVAMAAGDFSAAAVREQAAGKGLKRVLYHEIEIWVTPGKDTLSIARMSDQLVLLGLLKNLQDAIDRSQREEANREYSPLLARAARYAQDDLFVVAAHLPDPLAARFVPIDAEAEDFEGGVSLTGGLRLSAVLSASSEEAAAQLAGALKGMVASLPPVAQGIQVNIDPIHPQNVTLGMAITGEQLLAGLRTATPVVAKAEPKPEPVAPKPAGPQIIHIYGLDEGPREIVMR